MSAPNIPLPSKRTKPLLTCTICRDEVCAPSKVLCKKHLDALGDKIADWLDKMDKALERK